MLVGIRLHTQAQLLGAKAETFASPHLPAPMKPFSMGSSSIVGPQRVRPKDRQSPVGCHVVCILGARAASQLL
jgi:hypothetical protein